jgi:glycosyltransferase involved in cell wall biosynthesis
VNESSSPAVSVVIAAYNGARWIAETLDSVLAQTFRNFEVVVVDDGSSDETPSVVAGYGSRVRCLRRENGGQPSARNFGIRAARGLYIAFVDADDLWLPEKLQLQMELLSKHPDLAWVYSDAIVFDGENGKELYKISDVAHLYEGDILRPLLILDFIPSPTPVIRRDVFATVGYFDESPDLRIGEDWNMWLRIAAKYQVRFVNRPLAKYRAHSESMFESTDFQYAFRSTWKMIENAVARDPQKLSDLRERALAVMCVRTAGGMLKRGERQGARAMITRAMKLYPYDANSWAYWLGTFLPKPILNWLVAVRGRYRRLMFSTGKGELVK